MLVLLALWPCAIADGAPRQTSITTETPQSQPGPTREFEITAERFTFTPSTLEVREGDRVKLTLRSRDVTHGFAIETLGIRQEVPRGGEPVVVEFIASTPGVHRFACSVFCGRGHATMAGILTIVPRTTAGPPPATAGPAPQESYPGEFADLSLDRAQPDFTLITLPTTKRVPRYRAAFRVTHRFARTLGRGNLSNLAADFFGLDGGALIGLELRFGVAPGTQVSVYRTSDRTIRFSGQRTILQQSEAQHPIGLDFVASIDGLNNFRRERSPSFGIVVSRKVGDRAAFYLEPMWLGNADVTDRFGFSESDGSSDDYTVLIGLAARVRLTATSYAVTEFLPRVRGFDPGDHVVTFGFEKQVGGHMFQLNVSNSLGTMTGRVARGGDVPPQGSWTVV